MAAGLDAAARVSGFDRDPDTLARKFHVFGRVEAPPLDSPMYAELSYGVSNDPQLLALAARTRIGQPPPNMLYAAVQYLLLGGIDHELRRHYPAISGEPRPGEPAFPAFRDFCLRHAERIAALLETRMTQTNVVLRCACLLPAFSMINQRTGQPLALLEVGPSAGLNLNWDRYRYRYRDSDGDPVLDWGPETSPVVLESVLRGRARPRLAPQIPVAGRTGVDLNPIALDDTDAVRWLQALIWPEHEQRHAQLRAAIDIARQHPPELVQGDALTTLPGLLQAAPGNASLVVFATHVLYQFPREAQVALFKLLAATATDLGRELHFLSMESTREADSQLTLHRYRPGVREREDLARVNPHGYWLRWEDGSG